MENKNEKYIQNITNILINNGILKNIIAQDIKITKVEITILSLIYENKSNKDIAEVLNISIRTVENHRNKLRKKFKLAKQETLLNYLIKNLPDVK